MYSSYLREYKYIVIVIVIEGNHPTIALSVLTLSVYCLIKLKSTRTWLVTLL